MQAKVTKITLVAILALVFAVEKLTDTYVTGDAMVNQFMHANIFHLLLNCWAVRSIVRGEIMPPCVLAVVAVLLGWVGFLCGGNVVGFSGALYAMLGIQWKIFGTKTNVIVTASVFALGIILPGLAFVAHVLPFCLGLAVGWAYNMIKNFNYETR